MRSGDGITLCSLVIESKIISSPSLIIKYHHLHLYKNLPRIGWNGLILSEKRLDLNTSYEDEFFFVRFNNVYVIHYLT